MRHFSYFVLVAASTIISCIKGGSLNSDDDNNTTENVIDSKFSETGENANTCVLSGNITEDLTLNSDCKWILSGGVYVMDGITLTIDPGTTIYAADDGTVPFLSILQGGKINAQGTAEDPIVFTTEALFPGPGAWGGIVINGQAPINKGTTSEGKGGTGTYGGNYPADNSGILSYVRVEYAGMKPRGAKEMKAFSFNGCGSATILHHLQAYKCANDGFKFSGGEVSLRYAMATGCEDDGFNWTNGWSGNGQFWVVHQNAEKGDRGIVANNNEDNNMAFPSSNPKLANITLIGADDGDRKNQGIKLHKGTQGQLANIIVTGFPKRGCHVHHDQTIQNMYDGTLSLKHSIIDNHNPFKFTNSNSEMGNEASTFTSPEYNNLLAEDGSLTSFLKGYVGTADGTFNSAQLGEWFEPTTFIGAVSTNDNWTLGWTKEL